jgi:hypothetical protein
VDFLKDEDHVGEEENEYFSMYLEDLKNISPDIPIDPSPDAIKQILGETGSLIEYMQVKMIEFKKMIDDKKWQARTKKEFMEIERGRIRQERAKKYQKQIKDYVEEVKKLFQNENKTSTTPNKADAIPKAILQEVVKSLKPDKPTKNELDDLAMGQTQETQEEIFAIEKEIIDLEEQRSFLQAKIEKYENKFKAAIAIKGILVEEMKKL